MEKVVTRIPPSPTGHLHIGTARTALYNFLFARKHKGDFIMRSEDTDRARSTLAFEEEIREGLAWLSLTTDSFSRQSERAAIYRSYLEKIINEDKAYISKEESKSNPGESIEVVRLRNPNIPLTFTDEVRGNITFDTTELGDFVIARSLDDALYHFAVVVDDFEMGVTHVIRGEDHISNTPRQILIQEAIGAPRPYYAHLPLILALDRSKMSKRHGAVALYQYRDTGFFPQAILNYLALLGWNPGTPQEIFSLPELIEAFDLTKIQKAGAVFDIEKLKWFNKEWFKIVPQSDIEPTLRAALKKTFDISTPDERVVKNLIHLIRDRSTVLSDITKDVEEGEYDFAFKAPVPDPALIKWKKDETAKDALPRLHEVITRLTGATDSDNPEAIKSILWDYAEKVGKGEVLWPLRVSLTGKEKSPDPFTVIATLGIPEALRRIQNACDTIEAS
jgi:glutamyl-tRNA synthetase